MIISHTFNTPKPELDLSGKNILIVDDFSEMRTVLRNILCNCEADSKKIMMANNGNEAIALLKETKFDIVLCDFILNSGKNGQQVLEHVKHQSLIDPSCLWIMISAEKTMEAVSGAAEYKPDAYILKPITEDGLRSRLIKIQAKKEAFTEIYSAMKQQDYAKAMQLCNQRLVSNKAYIADLLRIKCDLLFLTGEYEAAQQFLGKILAERDIPWAKVSLAKILLKKNELDPAKDLLTEAIETNPAYLEAQDLLAETLHAQGQVEEAATILERTVKLSPNSIARQRMLGDIAMKTGKLPDAERAFRKCISLGENSVHKSADTYLSLAKVCSANKNPIEALKTLDQLGKNFSTEEIGLKGLSIKGFIYHQNGSKEKARKIADELTHLIATTSGSRPGNGDAVEIARLLMVAGDKDKAIELLQNEIRCNPDNTALLSDITEIFDQAGMAEKGNQLIEASRQEALLIMNRGVLLISKGKYEEAVKAMREANTTMPSNTRVLLNLAHVIITYIQKNGPSPELIEEARSSLTAANQLSPGEPRFARLMASLNELTSAA